MDTMHERYPYRYQVGLAPICQREDTDFTKIEPAIKRKLAEYSELSAQSLKNSKMIEEGSVIIQKQTIVFTLLSENELPSIGRALRFCSQRLLEITEISQLIVNKKLFRTFIPVTEDKQVMEVCDAVSDAEFVKAMVDYLTIPQSKQKREIKEAVQKMKALALQSGLVIRKES